MTADQLTLSGLLDELAKVPQDAIVKLAGFGSGSTPGVLFRHRPYVDGLAITPTMVRSELDSTVAEYSDFLRQSGPGLTWRRPTRHITGVDVHPGTMHSPMWVSFSHEICFHAVTGIEMIKGYAVIRTTNLAPMQGPTIQRISDEEVSRRMRNVDDQLRGESKAHSPNVLKWLINMAAKDRTTIRLDLEEAQWDLANFEASLQAKRDRVAKLEADAARNDYLLGITDDLPEILKVKESR